MKILKNLMNPMDFNFQNLNLNRFKGKVMIN